MSDEENDREGHKPRRPSATSSSSPARPRREEALHDAIGHRVVGQAEVVDLMLVALLARGRASSWAIPGLAKTLLVASLAEALDLSFGRVQFTPDLLPADITGTDVLQEDEDEGGKLHRRVRFHSPGRSSTTLILADEINRTPRGRARCCRACKSAA
ncbi:MAG: AAA family ATPase [Labilithrix sp.]